MGIEEKNTITDEIYDRLNLKTVCEDLTDHIPDKTQIVQVLDVLLDGLDTPEMKNKYIKCIQSESGSMLAKLGELTENGSQLRHNAERLVCSVPTESRYVFFSQLASRARYRFSGHSEMAVFKDAAGILDHPEEAPEKKDAACIDVLYTAAVHGLKNPSFMPHIYAQNMISQSYIFRYDEEPRYNILRCFAEYSEQAALLAGDYYSNTGRVVEAARVYIQHTRSSAVMTDIGLFLEKNRRYQLRGILSEEDVNGAYGVMKAALEKKINAIIDADGEFSVLDKVSTGYPDLDTAFRILYIYAIKEPDSPAANGAGAIIRMIWPDLDDPEKELTEEEKLMRQLRNKLDGIACSTANLMHLNSKTTGTVNDLIVRKTKSLPLRGKPETRLSEQEYDELKENLDYLSTIFPTARYNACRLRYLESVEYETEFNYEDELKTLKKTIGMIPEDNPYHNYAGDFYKEIAIEYHKREIERLTGNI